MPTAKNLKSGEDPATSMLVGPGWIISASDHNAITALQLRMGGTVERHAEG